ncbi:MAG: PDZ domain-containing protein, partial [Christensenellales bacterium]|nr:PDZ domain-containing protein [Christensenellales bacterium]
GGEVLANTVTQGIVSALERTGVRANNTTRSVSYIQHDAAINSGNSGGGLFNYRGELVGINTLKYGGSLFSTTSFEGLGFAIPIDSAYEIAMDLIEFGKVIRPGLNVTVSTQIGPEQPMQNYAPASVVIRSVTEGGPADKAGILQYDFLIEADGERITSTASLSSVMDRHQSGDTITVKVVRYEQVTPYGQNPYAENYGYSHGYSYGYSYGNSGGSTEITGFSVSGNFEILEMQVTLEDMK